MPRNKYDNAGLPFGILAALCWSIHFPLILNRLGEVPLPVFYFHSVFWGAIASTAVLTISGRIDDLSIVNRKSGAIFLLVITCGYGMWMFLSGALGMSAEAGKSAEAVFYTAPLLLVFLSMFTKSGAGRVRTTTAITGFAGALIITVNTGVITAPPFAVVALSLAAALLWAVFSLAASSLIRNKEVVPALVLTLSVGAVCLFLTCISMGLDALAIGRDEIWVSMLAGVFSIACGLGFWMKCMQLQASPAKGSTWWYGALIFGVFWYHFFSGYRIGWIWASGGIVLILLSFRTGSAGREKTRATFGDMIVRGR